MKKTLLLLCAFIASIGAIAQNNITSGKTVVPLGGLKTYTHSDGTTTYTISNTDLQKITVDGNTDNIYLFPEDGGNYNTDGNKAIGIQGFYIDLGSAQAISNIQTTWEGAAASYKVYLTDTQPAADGTLTGETEIADYTNNGQEATKNIAVSSSATGRYIVCVPQVATNYEWGVKIRTFVALDKTQAVLGSLTVTPAFAEAGGTQTFTPSALSTTGIAISEGVTYTFDGVASDLQNVSVSAGEHTIVATYNGNTASATVYGITVPAAPDASSIVKAMFANDGTASEGTTSFENYDQGTNGVRSAIEIGTSKVINATNSGKLFIYNPVLTNELNGAAWSPTEKGYKSLSVDLWSANAQEGTLYVSTDASGDKTVAISLAAATWKTVKISLDGITDAKQISVRMNATSGVYPDFLVANVYFLNTEVEANPFNIITNGVVTGDVTAAKVAEINANTSAVINLYGANIKEAVTLTPANSNAVVVVKGTGRTPDASGSNVTASNIVVHDGTWYRAKDGVEITITDNNNAQPNYGFTIDAKDGGFSITRTLPAGKYVTTVLPATIAAATLEGTDVQVYELTAATASTLTFTKKATAEIIANTPYVLYSASGATITATKKGDDLNLNQTTVGSYDVSPVSFKGTYAPIATDGTQWVLSSGDIKKGNGATIGSFRAYFTGLTVGARALFIDDEETTKIGAINANGEIETGVIYNLSGQCVQNPTKGLYIVNGKKVAIK